MKKISKFLTKTSASENNIRKLYSLINTIRNNRKISRNWDNYESQILGGTNLDDMVTWRDKTDKDVLSAINHLNNLIKG